MRHHIRSLKIWENNWLFNLKCQLQRCVKQIQDVFRIFPMLSFATHFFSKEHRRVAHDCLRIACLRATGAPKLKPDFVLPLSFLLWYKSYEPNVECRWNMHKAWSCSTWNKHTVYFTYCISCLKKTHYILNENEPLYTQMTCASLFVHCWCSQ